MRFCVLCYKEFYRLPFTFIYCCHVLSFLNTNDHFRFFIFFSIICMFNYNTQSVI